MGKLGAALIFALVAQGAVFAQEAGAVCAPGTVELRSGAGAVMRFTVELADDAAERAQGLMNRPQMASSAGMLFVYQRPQHSFFWMKNTLIPLDMIFADATGTVTHVHSNAKTRDTTSIDGGENVTYVLEINGGLAKRLGLGTGSVMRSAVMDPSMAVWPCSAE